MATRISKKAIAIAGLLVVAPVGCAMMMWSMGVQAPKPRLDFTQPMHFYVYVGGGIAHSGELSPDSPVRTKLDQLLKDHDAKWTYSYVTFAPRIAFRTENYSITLQENRMVLNYNYVSDSPKQIIRDLPEDAFMAIKRDLTREE